MPRPPTGQTHEIGLRQTAGRAPRQWLAKGEHRLARGRSLVSRRTPPMRDSQDSAWGLARAGTIPAKGMASSSAMGSYGGHLRWAHAWSGGTRDKLLPSLASASSPAAALVFTPNYSRCARRFSQASSPTSPSSSSIHAFTRRSKAYQILLISSQSGASAIQRNHSLGRTVRFRSGERGRGRDRWRSALRIWQCGLALGASG